MCEDTRLRLILMAYLFEPWGSLDAVHRQAPYILRLLGYFNTEVCFNASHAQLRSASDFFSRFFFPPLLTGLSLDEAE